MELTQRASLAQECRCLATEPHLHRQVFVPQRHLRMDGGVVQGVAVQLHGGAHGVLRGGGLVLLSVDAGQRSYYGRENKQLP